MGSVIERRDLVPAIRRKRQRLDFGHRLKIKIAIKMRKQSATARGLPSKSLAEAARIHAHQHEVRLTREMFRRGLRHLLGRGEMNEAVTQVGLRAVENARALGLPPQRGWADFVDDRQS
jgi:hypothetical protein